MTFQNSTVIKKSSSSEEGYNFSYSLIESSECDDFALYRSYSILASIDDADQIYHDEVLVREVTPCTDTAEYIFDMISRGAVTPMSLRDVIEDLLCEV